MNCMFQRMPKMGGAAGEAASNTINASGLPKEAVLAREAIQNSVDAGLGGAKVRIDFREQKKVGEEKAAFVKAANLAEIAERREHILPDNPNCLDSLGDNQAEIRLLYIEDYGTSGLEGDYEDPESNYFKLLLVHGDGSKSHESSGKAGSYGFGKQVYSSNSAIKVFYAYSKTKDGNGNIQSYLFGCGNYKTHKIDGVYYTGRTWLGVEVSEDPQEVHPLTGEDADNFALRLGFKQRKDSELGTSILVIDSSVELESILEGVEDWWWPRIISNELDVQVIDTEEKRSFPRPRKRKDLSPFIEAYEIAIGTTPVTNTKEERLKEFQKFEGRKLGTCGFKALKENPNGEYDIEEMRWDSIALIRSPKMVVNYRRNWNPRIPRSVGVYVSDDAVNKVLQYAEPPAHDKWDVHSERLNDNDRKIVETILKRLRSELLYFQNSTVPPAPARPRRLTSLERNLSQFFSPTKNGSGSGPETPISPIQLQYDEQPQLNATDDGDLKMSAKVALRLKNDCDVEELHVRVTFKCETLADGKYIDPIPLKIIYEDGKVELIDQANSIYSVHLSKHDSVKMAIRSEPYDRNWTTRFVPEVTPMETGQ